MGWRFRKQFKILPGIRLNIGKRGISSVSVGPRGASTNVGKQGVSQTVGLPGTGLSYRTDPNGGGSSSAIIISGVIAGVLLVLCGICGIGAMLTPPAGNREIRQFASTPTPPLANANANKPVTKKAGKDPKSPKATPSPRTLVSSDQDRIVVPGGSTTRSSSSRYQLGPRGGCFYINSNGKKTYVDHSYCY